MWLNTHGKAIQAPLPDDIKGIKAELDYLQRQLIHFNSRLPMPRGEARLKFREWDGVDDGISVLIDARVDVIETRERWAEFSFKHPNRQDWRK